MKLPFRFPIGVKLSIASIVILLIAMVPSALKTSNIFKSVSGKREEDSNRAQAEARASEVSVTIEKVVEKVSFYGPLLVASSPASVNQASPNGTAENSVANAVLLQSFKNDSDIISLEVYRNSDKGVSTKVGKTLFNGQHLKSYNLTEDFLAIVDKERPFPLVEAFSGQIAIRNRSMPSSAPIMTLGVPLVKDDLGRVTHVAVANIRLNTIQKAFGETGERIVYLVDRRGTVYAHPKEKLAMNAANIRNLEIVRRAIDSKVAKGQLKYSKKGEKENFISAFTKTPYGLIVISEAPESVVLEPAAYVQRQVYFITSLVLSGSLMIVFILSLTITRPIQRLVLVTREIARGNFGINVARMVTTNDEVGTLAVSFDAMLAGLRERDKVKSLFNKFHGSSVTESLMASDKVETGGVRKKVVVLFCDIRDFTAISERSSPEQVVSMLNEYFSIMVRIILSNGGIVDKFIGDAMMAIWGAPSTTGQDSTMAVKTCLEMRKALAELNQLRISRGEFPIKIGIGLHTGEAISGNIGSEERMEFTVIGDTVNMASRIEASTKAFGTDLLISDDLAQEVGGKFILEVGGTTKVKGKTEPLKLHKCYGFVRENGEHEIIRTEYSEYTAEKADKVEIVA